MFCRYSKLCSFAYILRNNLRCGLIRKYTEKALKVFNSDHLITQKVYAIKTFLISSLDFVLSNGQMKIKHIDKLDSLISASINKLVGGNVPLSVKHGSWKDSGLSIPSLREKC